MALDNMAFGLVKSKDTGLIEMTNQPFKNKRELRERYPKSHFKLLMFPLKFDVNGYIQFDPTLDTDIGDS